MTSRKLIASFFLIACLAATPLWSQDSTDSVEDNTAQAEKILRVGIKEAVPFSIQADDGTWSGISVELWREIAQQLGYRYEFVALPLDELIESVESDQVDVAFGAITITAERERAMDFTHSYYNSGLGIAVSTKQHGGWTSVLRRISAVIMQVVAGIVVLLVIVGVAIYLLEHRKNPEHFGNGTLRGIANGIWWAAVTMTTVGYGDRTPQSVGGRLMAILWMFSAIVIIASFTASVTSTLTLAKLESNVRGPGDLHDVRVASVTESTSEEYLQREGIGFQRRADLAACLEDLAAGKVDAVVYDAPILTYQCLSDFPGELDVLPTTFEKQDYAFALPTQSDLREPINRAMLKYFENPVWLETIQRYLGNQTL